MGGMIFPQAKRKDIHAEDRVGRERVGWSAGSAGPVPATSGRRDVRLFGPSGAERCKILHLYHAVAIEVLVK